MTEYSVIKALIEDKINPLHFRYYTLTLNLLHDKADPLLRQSGLSQNQ